MGELRRDYAIFTGDAFVTNALLTDEEANGMRDDGYKLMLPDSVAEWGIPAFRGNGPGNGSQRSVRPTRRFRGWE